MFKINKTVVISAAHFLRNYDGPCACLHGHNYSISVSVSSNELNETGMIIDFSEIRRIINRWDHILLNDLPEFSEEGLNPTSENIAFMTCLLVAASLRTSPLSSLTIETSVYEKQNNLAVFEGSPIGIWYQFSSLPMDARIMVESAALDLGLIKENESMEDVLQINLHSILVQG